jgi:ribosomal protein S18 acetylase RimI-like enzyme
LDRGTAVEVRALRPADLPLLTELHNAAFGDYLLPVALDRAALAGYLAETDVALELSRLVLAGGEPASFCLGALRGARGSVRGEGTHPAHRRAGHGSVALAASLAALRSAGAREVVLEVLGGNHAALALYRRAGFNAARRLFGFDLPAPAVPGEAAGVDAGDALERLGAWWPDDPPWQLAPATLAHLEAWELGRGAVALGKLRSGRAWLYAVAVDPALRRRGLATRLVASLPAATAGIPALVPGEWTGALAWLDALGAVPEHNWQWEMRLAIGS